MLTLLAAGFGQSPAAQPLTVIDDIGQSLTLEKPAQRVISLAPHTTELLYAAGGQSALIAAVAYSDYPAKARTLPRVGDSRALDIERILALKPDLIVAWPMSSSRRVFQILKSLHLPLFYSDPHTLQDISSTLKKLGVLLGTSSIAQQAASQFESDMTVLQKRYAARTPIRVFYQVSDRPLITLNGQAMINQLLAQCGGINVFAAEPTLAPAVSTEAMLATKPDVIIVSRPTLSQPMSTKPNKSDSDYVNSQTPRSHREASIHTSPPLNSLYPPTFQLESDLLDRPGPRLVQGGKQLCDILDFVRRQRIKPTALTTK